MEYSKEDLMEAKRQILGVGENMGTEESKKIWEKNAQFWDNAMGDKSNEFHREVVRPKVTELLSPNPADYILDIACGNGNYSSYLAQRGASIVAFDYSKKMIELAKRRQSQYAKQIEFCVADATDRKSILELKRNRAKACWIFFSVPPTYISRRSPPITIWIFVLNVLPRYLTNSVLPVPGAPESNKFILGRSISFL